MENDEITERQGPSAEGAPSAFHSALMARVRSKDTLPELLVRREMHRQGYRFRLHRRDLPGTPDIVLPKRRLVILVHGCFWHRHLGCRRCTTPKTRTEFWQAKFEANIARDARNIAALETLGWRVAVVWECQTVDVTGLKSRLADIISPDRLSAIGHSWSAA